MLDRNLAHLQTTRTGRLVENKVEGAKAHHVILAVADENLTAGQDG